MYNHILFYATITVDTLSDRDVIIYFVFPNIFQTLYYHQKWNSKSLYSPAHEYTALHMKLFHIITMNPLCWSWNGWNMLI